MMFPSLFSRGTIRLITASSRGPLAVWGRNLVVNVCVPTAAIEIQARRRQRMERFSILAAENCVPISIEHLAELPVCCAPIFGDDPMKIVGINFWAVEASGDAEGDHAWGEFLAEDVVRYVRERDQPEFLTVVLLWIGAILHFEERCAAPLENGFVYRVLQDYPDAIDQLFMAVHRQHPEALN
jgi:hypothetical protein